jgi:tetratricopeptide (TPR) repeat protein
VLFALREVVAGVLEIQGRAGGNVAHWAHIGGLGLGALAAVLVQAAREGKRESVLEDTAKATAGSGPQDRTRRDVARLLKDSPDDPEALEAMAALLLVGGERVRSRELYLKAIARFMAAGQRERAAIVYLNLLHTASDTVLDPREQITVASTLEALGHHREAQQAFELLADHYPEREEAQTALLRASQLYQRCLGEPAVARQLLQRLLDSYPNSQWITLARERIRDIDRLAAG